MFELPLVVGLGAIIVCFLKGRPLRATVTLIAGSVLVVAGVAFTDPAAGPGFSLIGVVAFAALALWAALPAGEPGSAWVRASAVDAQGRRMIDLEPRSRRWGRAAIGGLLGLAPAILYVAVVVAIVEMFGLSGDTAQLGFLGIPFGLFGLLAGVVIGFHWMPRRTAPAPKEGVPRSGSAVMIGVIAGVLAGVAITLLFDLLGLAAGPALTWALVVSAGGTIGGLAGRRRTKEQAPPKTPVPH